MLISNPNYSDSTYFYKESQDEYIPRKYIDKEPRVHVIHVNSENADSFNKDQFSIALITPIIINEDEKAFVSVANISIPYSFYSVSELNNTLTITESDINGANEKEAYDIVIPSGNWIIDDLITELKTQLTAKTKKGVQYNIIYVEITNKCIITTITPNIKVVFDLTMDNACYHQYGFTLNKHILTSNAPLISDSVVEVANLYNLYIRLLNYNLDQCYDSYTKKTSNIICKVPINVAPLEIIYSNDDDKFMTPIKSNALLLFEFALTDEYERTIDLNYKPWTFDLVITINKLSIV